MSTSRSLDRVVRERAPHPVAAAWHRVLLALGPAEKLVAIGGFTDVLVRTLNALVLPDYLRGAADPDVEQRLHRLSRPALGVLAGLYRSTCAALASREDVFWREPVLAGCAADAPATRALDALVELRNRAAHDTLPSSVRAQLAGESAAAARDALLAMPWLLRARFVRVVDERSTREGTRTGALQFFVGTEPLLEPVPATWSAPLARDGLYLVHPEGDRLLDVDPFLAVRHVDGANQDRLHLWKKIADLHEFVLINDDAGHVVRHRPLIGSEPLDFRAWLQRRDEHPVRLLREDRAREALRSPPVELSLPMGTVLDDRFEILGVLGEGGMATVYRCLDRVRREPCALKVLHAHAADGAEFRARFKREARTLRTVQHPHVVPVDDAFEMRDGRLCLRMPVLAGGTLADRVQAGGAAEERVRRWAAEALEALTFLHERGIVHRDIKPANLLLDGEDRVVLADFGVAWRHGDPRVTRGSEVIGTTAYLAPELRRGGATPTGAADLYSLALALHEALTGDARAVAPGRGLDTPFGGWLAQLADDDPAARPVAAAALAALRALPPPTATDAPASFSPAKQVGDSSSSSPGTASGEDDGVRRDRPSMRKGPFAPPVAGVLGVIVLLAVAASLLPRPRCGDGVRDDGEDCDDGNAFDGDRCSAGCREATAVVPAGPFWMGFREEDIAAGMHRAAPSRRPDEYLRLRAGLSMPATPVLMSTQRIARHEVSRGAFAAFLLDDSGGALRRTRLRSPESEEWHEALITTVRQRHAADEAWRSPSEPTLPVEVPFDAAVAFCAWAGGSLPTESTREYAARGPGAGRIFPWGDRAPMTSPADCGLLTAHFTTSMEPPTVFDCGGRRPTPVGSRPAGCTPDGVCDLSGNVDEWVHPGPVRWQREPDPNTGDGALRLVARLPGQRTTDGSYDLAMPCAHLAVDDPLGLRSGFVVDCYRPGDGRDAAARHPASDVLGVVRGGNYDDSLPVFYQTRGRYPYFPLSGHKGFRCVFFDEP
jgi:cysteine-rich repeat protein